MRLVVWSNPRNTPCMQFQQMPSFINQVTSAMRGVHILITRYKRIFFICLMSRMKLNSELTRHKRWLPTTTLRPSLVITEMVAAANDPQRQFHTVSTAEGSTLTKKYDDARKYLNKNCYMMSSSIGMSWDHGHQTNSVRNSNVCQCMHCQIWFHHANSRRLPQQQKNIETKNIMGKYVNVVITTHLPQKYPQDDSLKALENCGSRLNKWNDNQASGKVLISTSAEYSRKNTAMNCKPEPVHWHKPQKVWQQHKTLMSCRGCWIYHTGQYPGLCS